MATKTKAPAKTSTMSASFKSKLASLNIHPSEVANGQTIRKLVTVNSVAEFKEIFGHKNGRSTSSDYTDYLKSTCRGAFKSTKEEHLQVKLAAHIYGNHPLSTSDRQMAAKYFPIQTMVEAGSAKTIDTPVKYGPSASPVTLLYDKLTFTGKGSITTENTILNLTAIELVVGNLSGGTPFLINILGVTGKTGNAGTAGTSFNTPAKAGDNATEPTPGICTGSRSPSNGDKGQNGGNGQTNGDPGKDGLPNLQATITVDNTLTGSLSIFTKSGNGGAGGAGGAGGKGQDGGKGGNGCDTGCECTDAANGGNGGNGGNGSDGGDGGNGTNGNDIFIKVPSSSVSQIIKGNDVATPGLGGAAGALGQSGSGGAAGTTGTKHCSNGNRGSNGSDGAIGKKGGNGTQNGAPGNIRIN